MGVDGIGGQNAEAIRAAIEAARRAAEEAARKAAEAAAKKAAEEAQRRAQEAMQRAQEANARRQADAARRLGEADRSASDGGFGVARFFERGREALDRAQVQKITPQEAKADAEAIRADLAKADTPQEVKRLSARANELMGRTMVSADEKFDPAVAREVENLRNRLDRAADAVTRLEETQKALAGTPEQRAAETARLLTHPDEFGDAVKGLRALEGTPVFARLAGDVTEVVAQADPAALATQLRRNPDLSDYPADIVENLAALRQLPDPALQSAIDTAAERMLDDGVSLKEVQDDPAKGQLLANLQQSDDPAVRARLEKTVKGWAKQSLEKSLAGKEKESGVEEAMAEYTDEMVALAKRTGLGPTIGKVAEEAAGEMEDEIKKVAERGKSFLEKVGGVVGDAIGGVGKLMKSGLDKIGDAVEVGMELSSEVATLGFDVAAAGLDAVGADAAADGVRRVDDAVEGAYRFVGRNANGFADGLGTAALGMGDGLKFMVQNPVEAAKGMYSMVRDPELIVEAGKMMWNEAREGGWAHAAGYVVGNAAPMLLGGGGALTAAGRMAQTSRFATVARAGVAAEKVASAGGKYMGAVESLNKWKVGEVMRTFNRMPDGAEGSRLTNAVQSLDAGLQAGTAKFKTVQAAYSKVNDAIDAVEDTRAFVQNKLASKLDGIVDTDKLKLTDAQKAGVEQVANLDQAAATLENPEAANTTLGQRLAREATTRIS